MTGAGLISSFLAFLFNFIVVKLISPAIYGEYSTALAYAAILSAPLTVFGLMVIRRIGQVEPAERALATWQLQKQLSLSFQKRWYLWATLLIALAFILAWGANFSSWLTIFYIITTLIVSFFAVFYSSALQAHKYFVSFGIISITAALWKILGGLVLVRYWPFLLIIYLVVIGVPLLTALVGRLVIFRRLNKKTLALPSKKLKPFHLAEIIKKPSFLVPLSAILSTTLLLNLDLVIIKLFLPNETVGIYGVLALFVKILFYASSPIINTAYTFFTGSESRHQNKKVLCLATGAFLALGVLMYFAYKTYPDLLIKIVSSNDYLSLAPILFLAAFFGTIYSTVNLLSQYLVAKNSLWVAVPLLICVLQTWALVTWHQNFTAIISVNIASGLGFLLIYLVAILHLKKGASRAADH